MNNKERILDAIFSALEETNQQLPSGGQLKKSPDTILFGRSGMLDSMALVSLIVSVEENIAEKLGIAITIADERAVSQKSSPFQTVKTLTDYTELLVNEKLHG